MTADTAYVGIRIQGGLLPAELLSRLGATNSTVPGLTSADYGLAAGETVREAANRVWAYLTTAWAGYRAQLAKLPATDRGTTVTRDRWLQILLDQLGYGRVQPTPAGGILADGKQFPVSHEWGPVPIHLLGARIDLDKKTPGVAGAAGQAPQSMVQELLNRSEPHLWAILSNGMTLRLLRDSASLIGSAYVEFDLEAIFDGELFSDFLLLFTLVHSTRLAIRDTEIGPASCWLEQWRQLAVEDGSRALDQLRDGVVAALETLGAGFLGHPANAGLRARYESGELGRDDYQHALLRVVYRLLFSFVAEDRGALLSPDATAQARQRYTAYFSTDRLRRTARRRRGGRHGDRWRALQLVWSGLGADAGRPELGIAGIGGLFERGELDFLADAELSNESLLKAVRSLTLVREKRTGQNRVVNYRDLDAEELGSIYEALLEYVPNWNPTSRAYKLGDAAGNTRKTTGSYYTPTSLIESLLDTALDPVLDAAEKRGAETGDVEAALLAITVCDPACGSGHFLVAAARRIAKRLAAARTGDPEPPPAQVRTALREVIGRCIYGVDLNPLAAELAKVSLWLEAMEPGKPLAFLDAQIKVGNALIGATPALLDGGLPQEAFKPIEGDDKRVASALAKRNKDEAGGQGSLFDVTHVRTSNTDLARSAAEVLGARMSLADIHVQQQRLKAYADSAAYRQAKLHADAWCAAFVWPKASGGAVCPTNATLQRLRTEPAGVPVADEIARLAAEYRFFHWHLEFPHIFPTERPASGGTRSEVNGWYGGFTAVIGNPPWEQVEIDDKTYFSGVVPEIAAIRQAARRKALIDRVAETEPNLVAPFFALKRQSAALTHFARTSGRFPLTAKGRVNLYHLFGETFTYLPHGSGSAGVILPSGVVTDLNAADLCAYWIDRQKLSRVIDFINTKRIFEAVKPPVRFSLITLLNQRAKSDDIELFVLARDPRDLNRTERWVQMPRELARLLNPETGTLPMFQGQYEAEFTGRTYERATLLRNTKFRTKQGFVNMTTDSGILLTLEDLEVRGAVNGPDAIFTTETQVFDPVWESKLFEVYDFGARTFEGVPPSSRFETKASPVPLRQAASASGEALPRYWAPRSFVDSEWPSTRTWVLAGKEVTDNKTSSRTSVFCVAPRVALSYTIQIVSGDELPPAHSLALIGILNSMAFDFFARQKITGSHLTATIIRQLPIPSDAFLDSKAAWDNTRTVRDWLSRRAASLSATTPRLLGTLSAELGELKVLTNENAREQVERELDAALFHAYGLTRGEVDYALSTFPASCNAWTRRRMASTAPSA